MTSTIINLVNNILKKKKKLLPKTVYINYNNNNTNSNNNSNRKSCKIKEKSNWISTTKYSLITFVPKNLFEQFRKFTNLYFLFILILSWFPNITPLTPGPSSINLSIVLLINAIKEGYEDFRRYQSDKRTNYQKCKVLNNGILTEKLWKDLNEGDIVFIENGQQFPADLILLATSGESSAGQCFIETSNLDGESNLKYKQALLETNNLIISTTSTTTPEPNLESSIFNETTNIECEAPNLNLNKFDGAIQVNDNNPKLPLTIDQLLIRGTVLMNTKFIYGVVIYVGHETKYMLNTTCTPSKRSKLELTMQKILLFLLMVQILLCLLSTFMGLYFDLKFKYAWYLKNDDKYAWNTFIRFFTFLILFSTLIPISLCITLEVIRFLQVISINRDKKMCYIDPLLPSLNDDSNKSYAMARTSNLNEELGQVEYIFSDKTGTLTKNEMVFKICCINGKIYGELPVVVNNGSEVSINDIDDSISSKSKPLSSLDLSIEENLEFIIVLSICNTVLPTLDSNDNTINYSSSSPDETALVEAASLIGIKLYSKTPKETKIFNSITGEFKTYQLLNVIEFTSDRKRMSIIIKDKDKNEIILYTKGADSVILPLLCNDGEDDDEDATTCSSKDSLRIFSINGLRTLCISKRVLSESEYEEWNCKYKESSCSIIDRDLKLNECSNLIERELRLLGITAIEDKLQDYVSDTISTLLSAGIKIFILTGDKTETAINIGISCSLLKDLELLLLNDVSSIENLKDSIESLIKRIGDGGDKEFGLIIDGNSITYLIMSRECEDLFYRLIGLCKSIVCCRVSPFQKAYIVGIVKDRTVNNSITLAIGDGANDVSMIQKAHIGIGIGGKEGRQAVLASDFSISQFQYLSRLLLVHGRFNYKRLSLVICYFFFKNLASCLLQFWFSTNNMFSGSTIYDSINSMLFNLTFTSLPIMVVGVFERDLSPRLLLKYPELYKDCQKGRSFNHRVFWYWIVLAVYSSSVIYYFSSLLYDETPTDKSGKIGGLRNQSAFAFTALVFVINFRLVMVIRRWTWLTYLSIGITLFFYFLVELIYSLIHSIFDYRGDYYHVFLQVVRQPTFYNSLVIIVIISLLPAFTISFIKRNYFPQPLDIIQEIQKFKLNNFDNNNKNKV